MVEAGEQDGVKKLRSTETISMATPSFHRKMMSSSTPLAPAPQEQQVVAAKIPSSCRFQAGGELSTVSGSTNNTGGVTEAPSDPNIGFGGSVLELMNLWCRYHHVDTPHYDVKTNDEVENLEEGEVVEGESSTGKKATVLVSVCHKGWWWYDAIVYNN